LRVYNIISNKIQLSLSSPDRPNLIIGPSHLPYLKSIVPNPTEVGRMYEWTDNPDLEGYKPVNIYNPRSWYHPGIGTKVATINKLTGTRRYQHTLYSLNSPDLHDRDYYMFYPVECDPISNIIYAICI